MTPAVLVALLLASAVLIGGAASPADQARAPFVTLRTALRRRGPGPLDPPAVDVPEVLDHLALALSGGAGVVPALCDVAQRLPDPARAELLSVAAAMQWGVDDAAAWAQAGPRWAPARSTLQLAAHAGVPPAGLLRAAATDLRVASHARIETATARLAVHLVLPLALAFLPAFVLTTVVPIVLALAAELLVTP